MAKQQKPEQKSAKQLAMEIAGKQKKTEVYENSKGEFFTDLNAAILSDKKENIQTHTVPVKKDSKDKTPVATDKPLEKMNKAELTDAYKKATGADEVPDDLDTNAKLVTAIKEAQSGTADL